MKITKMLPFLEILVDISFDEDYEEWLAKYERKYGIVFFCFDTLCNNLCKEASDMLAIDFGEMDGEIWDNDNSRLSMNIYPKEFNANEHYVITFSWKDSTIPYTRKIPRTEDI